jgi:hypothetical protein
MSELAILSEWAILMFHEVLAKLSFIFLFQSVKLSLISIEIFVIGLLSQLSNHFAWWIVEISFSLLIFCSFLFIFIFQASIFVRNSLCRINIPFRFIFLGFSIFNLKVLRILLSLDWSLWIRRWSFLRHFNTFSCFLVLLFLRLVVASLFFALRFFWILNSHFCNNTKIFIIYILNFN